MLATRTQPTYPGSTKGRGQEPLASLPIPPRTASPHHTPGKVTSGTVGGTSTRLRWRDRLHGPYGPVYVYALMPDDTKGPLLRIEEPRKPGKRQQKRDNTYRTQVRESREMVLAQQRAAAGTIVMGEMD